MTSDQRWSDVCNAPVALLPLSANAITGFGGFLMFDRRLLACVALLLIATAASAQTPAATLTLTDTARTASASGGPFFVPNESYTAALVLELAGMGNSDSFICDTLANPCYVVQLNVALPADYAQLHPTDRIRVSLGWDPQVSDLDMHIYTPPYD